MELFDIFLSYSHRDGSEVAHRLQDLLRQRGFTVFMDQIVLRTGDDLERSIYPKIRAAVLYIPVITPGFCDPNRWAFKEYEVALAEAVRRSDLGYQSTFVFPILHNVSGPEDAAVDVNPKLREHLSGRLFTRWSDMPSKLVSEVVMHAGVNEDFFLDRQVNAISPGRFPVTNVEYRRFINAGGYTNEGIERWWSVVGRGFWFSYVARIRHRYLWSKRTEDQVIDENLTGSNTRYNRFNQPVTGVSYFEAEAYCNWATETLCSGTDSRIRLPTEAEWLSLLSESPGKAPNGFGKFQTHTVNLLFSRATELTRGKLDLALAAKVSYPSVLGAYASGVSHVGCHDLIGNVWEWTQDFEDPKKARHLTKRSGNVGKILGNCCFDIPARVKFPPRELRFPGYRHHVIGFRVVKADSEKNLRQVACRPPRVSSNARRRRKSTANGEVKP